MDKNQIKFYTDLINDGEILLLKSNDNYFNCHYSNSPLNVLTGFSGTAGEALLDKKGGITIFVDTRYHLLAEKQVFKGINIYKMPIGESFFEAFKKMHKKNTILHVPCDINLEFYIQLDKYFDLRTYKPDKKFLKNNDINPKEKIFSITNLKTKNNFKYKIEKLKKIGLKEDKFLIFDLDEISYLTGLRSFEMRYSANFKSILYIDLKTDENILFLDKKNIKQNVRIENLKFDLLDNFSSFIQSKNSSVCLDFKKVSLENFLLIKKPKQIKNNYFATFASVKTKEEIEHLKNSCEKLDNAIYNFKNRLKLGLSEKDLVEIFEEELIKTGAKCPSFKTILAIDENSASIHYSQYDKKKILTGENIILLDCGGYYDLGLATDITRTFYFGYYPKDIFKKIYTSVLKAFIQCFLSNEKSARKIDALARSLLKPCEKLGFFFAHGLGHGIGTSVHQAPPVLNMISKDEIQPYQVHSIEPGLYGKSSEENLEFGIRIENCVYRDVNYKRHSLSKFPFEEILIDYKMLNANEVQFVKKWQNQWKPRKY